MNLYSISTFQICIIRQHIYKNLKIALELYVSLEQRWLKLIVQVYYKLQNIQRIMGNASYNCHPQLTIKLAYISNIIYSY